MTKRRAAFVPPILSGIVLAAFAVVLAEPLEVSIPDPDLSALEAPVIEQLDQMRELAVSVASATNLDLDILADSVGELGRHYHAYELLAPAETCYRQANQLAPRDFRWPYHLGYLHQEGGRLEEASDAYEAALAIHPGVPPALIRLGRVYLALNRPAAAERNLREALRLNSTSAAALAALGELELAKGRHREAVDLLEMALDLTPEANRLFYPLALAYRELGDTEKARNLLERRGPVGVKPADPLIDGLPNLTTGERVHLLRGQAAFRSGRFAEAAAEFRQAVEAQPESVAARIDLGSALGELGRIDEAMAEYETVIQLAPGNSTAHFNLGVLLTQRGEFHAAASRLKEAALYAPGDALIRLQLAQALARSQRQDEALVHYRASIELGPPAEEARLGEARVLVSQGRLRQARDRLEEAHALLPGSGLVASSLAWILAASPDPELRDGERALELARKVFAVRRGLPDAQLVAEALAQSGRCDEAAEWQRQVVEEASKAAQPPDVLARLRDNLDRFERGPPCRQ